MALLTPSKAAAAVGAAAVVLATIRASSVLAFVVTPAVAVLLVLAASFSLDLWKVCVSREVTREDRLRQALKPLSFTTSSAWSAGLTRLSWEERGPSTAFPIHPNMPETLQRFVDELLSFVRRDYIMPWYTKLSPSPAFGNAVELMIRQSLAALGDRAEAVDWATLAVTKMVPLLKDHILHFKTVESTQATSHGDSDPPLALPGKPHPAVAPQHTPSLAPAAVDEHLRTVAERALDHILPPKERASAAVRIMAREVVTTTILMPIVDVLSDGDFWNRMIEEKGKRLLNEEYVPTRISAGFC
jgi:sorting nexin-25